MIEQDQVMTISDQVPEVGTQKDTPAWGLVVRLFNSSDL
jgi:hypothetical protein